MPVQLRAVLFPLPKAQHARQVGSGAGIEHFFCGLFSLLVVLFFSAHRTPQTCTSPTRSTIPPSNLIPPRPQSSSLQTKTPPMRSLILSIGAVLLSSLVVQSDAQSCNGYAELCSKSYSKVAFATTHNSYAFNPPGGLATNQGNDIPTQLKDGIRAFMLDTYIPPSKDPKEIQLCHTSCK